MVGSGQTQREREAQKEQVIEDYLAKLSELLSSDYIPYSNLSALESSGLLVDILAKLKQLFPDAFPSIDVNGATAQEVLAQLLEKYPAARRHGEEIDWGNLMNYLYDKQEEGEQAAEKASQNALKRSRRAQRETYNTLVAVTGIILGLLFTAALMVDSPAILRIWALAPIFTFSFVILHLLFVTIPLAERLDAQDEGSLSQNLYAPLKRLVQLSTWRGWRRVSIVKAPNMTGSRITLSSGKDGKDISVPRRDVQKFLQRPLLFWFTAGVVASIAIVIVGIIECVGNTGCS